MELALLNLAVAPTIPSALSATVERLGSWHWDAAFVDAIHVDADVNDGTSLATGLLVGLRPGFVKRGADLDPLRLAADNPGRRLLVLAGPDVVRRCVATVLEVDQDALPLPEPCSVTTIRVSRSGQLSLMCFNDALHLLARPSVQLQEVVS